jgi:antitoxin component YwqK of YwqJK toxin-antitoxin module
LTTTTIFSQVWDSKKNLDTLRDKNGQILRIENTDDFEFIYFDYDSVGKLSKTTFISRKNGIQYDKVTDYFSNGMVARESFYYILNKIFFAKLLIDSTFTEYYENGIVKAKRFYVNGKENEKTIFYYQNGSVEKEMNYVDDKLMNIKCFDNAGNILDTGEFKDGNGRLFLYKEGVHIGFCQYKNGKMLKKTCICN